MLAADSCAWAKRGLPRAPHNFSNKHPPPSEAGLINSAGHRGGSSAILLNCQLQPGKADPAQSPSDPPRAGCRAGTAAYGEAAG